MFDFIKTWSLSCDVIRLICHTPHLRTIFLSNKVILGTCERVLLNAYLRLHKSIHGIDIDLREQEELLHDLEAGGFHKII